MKRYILSILCIAGFFYANAQVGANINCDSLKRDLKEQIAQLKKQEANKELIAQMELMQKQLLETLCKEEAAVMAGAARGNGMGKGAEKNTTVVKPQAGAASMSFSGNYTILIDVRGTDESGAMQGGKIAYYLDAPGKKIFLDASSFNASPELKALFVNNDSEGVFDGWLIENSGTHHIYNTAEEYGKVVSVMQMGKGRSEKKPAITVKAIAGTKTIAGYACTGYRITGNDQGEPIDLTCWVTRQDLPFQHPDFTMFSMMMADQLFIPGSARRGVLSVEGHSAEGRFNYTVQSIKPQQKKVTLSGYKPFVMPVF